MFALSLAFITTLAISDKSEASRVFRQQETSRLEAQHALISQLATPNLQLKRHLGEGSAISGVLNAALAVSSVANAIVAAGETFNVDRRKPDYWGARPTRYPATKPDYWRAKPTRYPATKPDYWRAKPTRYPAAQPDYRNWVKQY
ncbi:MAG: uncharacterized protein KVP18_003406 [Porospora cf. gigantea A]|uniref:uncharacterized protein n=1 Tax=Porospora cf. gigantea A TaxID=2853593 RepID=UPI0035596054|nr:MAG: hypothetical protein KVP18_003406 [Porospora cf. gigantea A]